MSQQEQQWEYCALVNTVVTDFKQPDGVLATTSHTHLIFYDDESTVRQLTQEQCTPAIRALGLAGWELVSATAAPVFIPRVDSVQGTRDAFFFKRPHIKGRKATEPTLNV